jgi:hypothetical protein
VAYIPRLLEAEVERAARHFPAVVLTGPRRSGKTTLLRRLVRGADYVLAEDPAVVARFRADPHGFLETLRPPVILDEIQNVPEVLGYVRARIDAEPGRKGRWYLTGSQEAPLMKRVTESMAGRAAILRLMPLSILESPRVSLFRGGYPEVLVRPGAADLWFSSYLQTYLERDVRSAANIRDLALFHRFLQLLATRTGQVLTRTDLAAPLGVSVPTVSAWIGILEVTAQILVVPPYFENFGKRLIKSPRLYVADPGLACHLLGIASEEELERSPFLGPLFEGFVAAEVVKLQAARGRRPEIYYFRDRQGLDVDLLVPAGPRRLTAVEAKASRTARPEMADPLLALSRSMRNLQVELRVVHRPLPSAADFSALRPGVKCLGLPALLDELRAR